MPDRWTCADNSDTRYNRCSEPEQDYDPQTAAEFVECHFTVGSIVWAKLDGFPHWPALIDDDPDTEMFFWTDENSDVVTW